MDLKNNQITIRELMAHPQARAVLAKHFPQVIHLPIVTKSRRHDLRAGHEAGCGLCPGPLHPRGPGRAKADIREA